MDSISANSSVTPVMDPETDTRVKRQPPYHVILENDEHHTMDFVIEVLQKVFSYELAKAHELMMHAHNKGEAVVWTGAREVAELKLDQMQSCHQIHPISGKNLGPLGCRIEPAA